MDAHESQINLSSAVIAWYPGLAMNTAKHAKHSAGRSTTIRVGVHSNCMDNELAGSPRVRPGSCNFRIAMRPRRVPGMLQHSMLAHECDRKDDGIRSLVGTPVASTWARTVST